MKKQIPSLTSLRGIAAVLVVFYHLNSSPLPVISRGYLWVDMFFILSGFVIALNYWELFDRHVTAKDLRRFIVTRLARIYPLHFASLAFLVVLELIKLFLYAHHATVEAAPFTGHFALPSLAANIFLLQGFGLVDANTWNNPSWSISCEFVAYLLFPFLLLFVNRWRWSAAALASAAVLGMALLWLDRACFEYADGWNTMRYMDGWNVVRALCEFAFGMLLFRTYAADHAHRFWSSDLMGTALWVGIVVGLALAPDIMIVALFCGIILAAAHNTNFVNRILGCRPLVYLGDISYSIYLIHVPILLLVDRAGKILGVSFSTILFVPIVTLLVSVMTHRYLERPAQALIKRRFIPSPTRPLVAA